jgi:glyoxylase-like metal-dependent hydrolase (beta-lactamase superfamily II)
MVARLDIIHVGYTTGGVGSTISLLRENGVVAVVDPGMVACQHLIGDGLAAHGLTAGHVTDVILSHHHPDHTLNAGLFAAARVHDHWATYHHNRWLSRDAEGAELSPSIRLIRTPGHTLEDISTLVEAADGLLVLTHLWWAAGQPDGDDPYAIDQEAFHRSRMRVLGLSPTVIVPGHGSPFSAEQACP